MSFIESLKPALEKRENLFKEGITNAYRLFCGEREGVSGLIADKYGDVVILQRHVGKNQLAPHHFEEIGSWYQKELGVHSVYLKDFISDRSQGASDEALKSPTPLLGEVAPEEFPILENQVSFLIRPYDGFSTGLFLDQRENRSFLAKKIKEGSMGKKVLNAFSYTCSFSVHAALAGAETTSVDLSKKALDWGRRNFVANGLDDKAHRFFPDDFFDFAKRAAKKETKFDLIILDPPSFARGSKGKPFSLAKDWRKLLEAAFPLLEKEGKLFFSSNFTGFSQTYFRKDVLALANQHLQAKEVALPSAAVDFQNSEFPLHCVLLSTK